jgi:predicted ArsR family transcriptional regulator
LTGHPAPGAPRSTRRTILALLEAAPRGGTASELAEALGLHPNAIRKQLRALAAEGAVGAERVDSGRRGRPAIRYRAAGAGEAAAVRRLAAMLVELVAEIDPEEARIEEFGRRQAPALAASGDGRTALLDVLTALGFAPRETTPAGRSREGRLEVVLGRCPFADAVEAPGGGLVCALHRGISRGLVELTPGGRLTGFEARPPRTAGCRIAGEGLPIPVLPG